MKMENGKKIIVNGPATLRGSIKIGGSKNAVLPILAATLITDEKCTVRNVPDLTDISTMIDMLRILGKKVERKDSYVVVESSGRLHHEAPYELVKRMRASILVMGALAGRKSHLKVPLPGGCSIGTRPIDLHLKGLKKMRAKLKLEGGFVSLSSDGLRGDTIYLDYPSVGATENLIMAACGAEGVTILDNTAKEPEVTQLVEFLRQMGAGVDDQGNGLKIEGGRRLSSVDFTVMDDRIQAGTYLIAGSIKGSRIEIEFSHPEVMAALIEKLSECNARIELEGNIITVKGPGRLAPTEIMTSPHPGFPTDLQAPFCSIMTAARGMSVITEEVFENRFMHCAELLRMGAEIEIKGRSAFITGGKRLSGAPVTAKDLRGGAALIIAGLLAKGRTEISGVSHIDRGYEDIVNNLKNLGADIWTE